MNLRQLQAEDIMAIKDNLVESRDIWRNIGIEEAKKMVAVGPARACVRNGIVIACCGVIKKENLWDIWALYSNSASCFERARAAILFRRELYKWKKEHPKDRVMFSIPSDLGNGKRYGDFLGAVFRGKAQSESFAGVMNNVYEVI